MELAVLFGVCLLISGVVIRLSVGLAANWVDVPGSASITTTNITVNPALPTVFYRLRNP